VSTEQGREAPPPNEPRVIHVQGVQAAQVGDYNVQYVYNHNYGPQSWTDSPGPLPAGSTDGSPYRGLRAFELRDAPFFFGRDQAVDELMSTLDERARGTGLVVLSGASGAGKSSMLRAGMLPRIRRDGLASMPGSSGWPCLLLTPGNAPLDELAVQVATLAGTDAGQAVRGLAADPGRFAYSARQAALAQYQGPGHARLVLVIDQFEHLFTQCQDSAQRRGYVAALHAAATGGGSEPAALIVLGVRAEFEARCAEFPELSDAINNHRMLTAMTERQLRLAITGPAGKAGAEVEDALVDALLAEIRARSASSAGVATAAGALPLLSYALDQTWRRRTGSTLTLADYERTGGIETAVAESAQHAYHGLSPAQRGTARQVFLQLTAVSDDGATDTAVPASRAELMAGKDPGDVQAVLDAFADERLLTLDADTVQISHEVLLTAWPLFRDDWLAQTRDDRVIRARLRVAAREWVNSRRDRSYLYSGIVLASATAVAERATAEAGRPWPLTDEEREFLRSGVRASQRRTQLLLGAVAVLTALVVALGVVTIVALNATAQSGRERDVDVAGELAAESEALGDTDPVLARLEAVAASRIAPSSDQAVYAMRSAATLPDIAVITNMPSRVTATAFSPSGRILALGSGTANGASGALEFWDTASHLPIGGLLALRGSGEVRSVAFSPDGRTLAAGTEDGGTWLWNVATRRVIGVLSAHGQLVNGVAFSPKGDMLAVASSVNGPGPAEPAARGPLGSPGVQLWNVASRTPDGLPLSTGPGAVAVAFSPDGRTVAVGPDSGPIDLWQFATDAQPAGISAESNTSLTFSPDGGTLATGGLGAQLWNVRTQRLVGTLGAPGGGPGQAVAFSPDGKLVAVESEDETVQLWDTATKQPASTFFTSPAHAGTPLAFSPDGTMLTLGIPAGLEVLDLAAALGAPPATLPASADGLAWTVSPDGTAVAVGSEDGAVQPRSTVTGKPVGGSFAGDGHQPNKIALSSGGAVMAVATNNGVFVRSAASRPLRDVPLPGTGDAQTIALSSDGTMLAVGFQPALQQSETQLWELPTRKLIKTIPAVGDLTSLSFSLNGKVLAVNDDHLLQLLDAHTGRQIGVITSGSDVYSVAFSPAGALLAAATFAGVQLWTVGPTPQPAGTLPTGVVNLVAFSPDGSVLATGTGSGTQLWDRDTKQQIGPLLPNSGSPNVLTPASASLVWSANGTTLAAVPGDGPAELWNVGYLVASETPSYLCKLAGHSLSPAQWKQYAQGVPYMSVCP
jgi:WD40 repeat protein